MTALPVFPNFCVRVYKEFVIAAGGGGDRKFGKSNGVVVYDLTTYKGLAFCSTEDDVIDRIEILDGKSPKFPIFEADSLVVENEDSCSASFSEEQSSDNVNVEISSNSKTKSSISNNTIDSESENKKSEKKRKNKNSQKDSINKTDSSNQKKDDGVIILACGMKAFYIIRFLDNKMKIIDEAQVRVNHLWCKGKTAIFVTNDNEIFGFYDIFKKIDFISYEAYKKKINILNAKSSKSAANNNIFTVKIFENNLYPVINNSICTKNDWHSFYYDQKNNILGKVYKIDKNYFVPYKNEIYKHENEVCEIIYNEEKDSLVYFTRSNDSAVCIIKDKKTEIRIPQITSLSIRNFICVCNADGNVYLLNGSFKKIKCYNMCLTSAFYDNGYVYYTSFNGLVDRKRIVNGISSAFILFLLTLIIAITFAYYRKS